MVLGEVVALGLAVAVSPFPVIPAILLLFTSRPRATSAGFVAGWVMGVLLATVGFVVLATAVERAEDSPTWVAWTRVAAGALLIALGARQWSTRRASSELPAWMRSIDGLTPWTASRLAVLLSAVNPKVLLLAAAAGVAIGSAELSAASTAGAVVAFTVVASLSVTLPLASYLVAGDRVLVPLGRVRTWLQDNNAAVMAVVLSVIGALVLAEGLSGV